MSATTGRKRRHDRASLLARIRLLEEGLSVTMGPDVPRLPAGAARPDRTQLRQHIERLEDLIERQRTTAIAPLSLTCMCGDRGTWVHWGRSWCGSCLSWWERHCRRNRKNRANHLPQLLSEK